MTMYRTSEYLVGLVREYCKLPTETEWVEFKHNNDNNDEIGEYLSALANSAALHGKVSAYLIWGIDDSTHEVVGTNFDPVAKKVGNEELENWLLRLLEPKIDFHFYSVEVDGKSVVLLEIKRAFRHPVRFNLNSGLCNNHFFQLSLPAHEFTERFR
jgi:ATP-dependent DNA helicase RecG